ncbi:MAG: DNA repair protein RecO [Haliangiales bacterium]
MARELLTTDALLLRSVDYGEADRILTFHTRARGRVAALARAARKSKRRFGGALGLYTLSRLQLRARPGADLWTLDSAQPLHQFARIAADMGSFAHAGYGTELVRELSPAEQPDEQVFELLLELYRLLDEHGPGVAVLRAFELGLLACVGLAPVLDCCVSCGRERIAATDAHQREAGIGAAVVLDPARGGVICRDCAALSRGIGVRPLSVGARQLLAQLQALPSLEAARTSASCEALLRERDTLDDAREAMLGLLLHHVGKPLRSLAFIQKMSTSRRRASAPPDDA